MLLAAVSLLFLFGALGMLLSAAVSAAPTGAGFWRLGLLLVIAGLGVGLGLRLVVPGATLPAPGAWAWLGWSAAALACVALGIGKGVAPERRWTGLLLAAGLGAILAVVADPALWTASGGPWERLLFATGLATVAPALGSVLLAMVLAHWYLMEPRLPVAPLQRVLALFVGTETVKLALLVAVVILHWPEWTAAPGGLLGSFVLGDALFVGVRGVLGILAPLGLGWMTWKTVQIRSIQSATGILYAAIVFVLFGEVISLYLSLASGRPF